MGEIISYKNKKRVATAATIAGLGLLTAGPAAAKSLENAAPADEHMPVPTEIVKEDFHSISWIGELSLRKAIYADKYKQSLARQKPEPKLTPAQIARREVTPKMFVEWSKVNVCEESGNWHVYGDIYSGGLGISNVNWASHGGYEFTRSAANATPDEQIVIARRIQLNPPDQDGCGNGW